MTDKIEDAVQKAYRFLVIENDLDIDNVDKALRMAISEYDKALKRERYRDDLQSIHAWMYYGFDRYEPLPKGKWANNTPLKKDEEQENEMEEKHEEHNGADRPSAPKPKEPKKRRL